VPTDRRSDDDFRREIEAHIDLEADQLIAEGLDPEAARAAAKRRFGSVTRVHETFYESQRVVWLDDLRRDSRYALNAFRRTPGFTVVAVLTLALAIGLNTAIFSVVDNVLLRPLPFPDADRLVRLFETNVEAGRPRAGGSPANFVDWRRMAGTLGALTAIGTTSLTVTGGAEPEVVIGMMVSGDFFSLAGATPVLGRTFASTDFESIANAALGPIASRGAVSGDATVIVSDSLWRRQFGGDPRIVGRQIFLNGRGATIIGVMHREFRLDETPTGTADIWLPLVESKMATYRRFRQFTILGRLKPGTDLSRAQAEMSVIAASLAREHPGENAGWGVVVTSLHESVVGGARAVLLILFGCVGCVLLIACGNVASLLLMLAEGRSREVALRMALCAGRSRLIRQWLTESVLLSLLGGIAGLALAFWAVPAIVASAPPNLPRADEIAVDARILAFTLGVSMLTGTLCGLAPAFAARTSTGRVAQALRSTGVAALGPGGRWLRQSLVVAQVGLAIVLLVGAGLLVRTLIAVHAVDLGFEPRNVLTFGVDLRDERYRNLASVRTFSRELMTRLEALPGVEVAGVGSVPLLGAISNDFRVEQREQPVESRMDVPSPGYFPGLGIRLKHGRFFVDADDQSHEPVAIVNRAFARMAWGSEEVVGRRLRADQTNVRWMTVVGVVDDLRMSDLESEAPAVVYIPYLQSGIATFNNYVVRTTRDPRTAIPLVRDAVRGLDAAVAVTRIASMEERVQRAVAPRAFNLLLIGLFAMVALVLAIVGLYGLISESVASRTSEIGIRMALGARRAEVIRLVLGRSLVVTAAGVVLGLGAAAAVTRYLESLLFGPTPLDPMTFAGVPMLFGIVAALAALVPARRATRVDPVVALRCE
jgi:predicted permease